MLKNLRNILPLPRGWKDDELRFGTRLNDAVTELLKNVRRLMALIAPESRQVVSTDMLLTDAQKRAAVENLGASKWIWLAPADNTWAAIWAKLSWINPGDVIPIYVASAPMQVLSDGALATGFSGTVGSSGSAYYFNLVSSSSAVRHVTMLVIATEAGVTRVVVNSTTDRIITLETDLDTLSDKLRVTTYSSVTDLNLASGATLAEIYSAMTYPSIGLFQANEVSLSDLPTSSSGGYIRIEKSTGARSRIFYYHKTDTTLDAEMPINSSNVPSGNWDMSNRSDVQTLRDDVDGLLDSALVKIAQTLTSTEQTQVRTNLGLGTASTRAVANNLTTTASGSVLDARQGKVLNDAIATKLDASEILHGVGTASTDFVLNLPNNSRAMVISIGAATSRAGIWLCYANNSGATAAIEAKAASDVTITRATNTITFAVSGGTQFLVLVLSGNVTVE